MNDAADGDALLRFLSALASSQRLRIVGELAGGRRYVSELARVIGMSRPLVHMHLQRLEAAGVLTSTFELGADGKAMKYFEVIPFAVELTPERIAAAARTLSEQPDLGRTGRTE
jgi:ArsR family transcriptional regulator